MKNVYKSKLNQWAKLKKVWQKKKLLIFKWYAAEASESVCKNKIVLTLYFWPAC